MNLVGKTIEILYIHGESQFCGKTGVVNFVDKEGRLHGSWGPWALIPGVDAYRVIEYDR